VGKSSVHGVSTLLPKKIKDQFLTLNCTVLKTIEELVKETYLEVSVLCLFFQQTRQLIKNFKIKDPPVILIYF
jgi:hypothetical protein